MGPRAVSLLLVAVLGLTATLQAGPAMASEGAPDKDTTTTMTREDDQCTPVQRRQDLLDNRMTERDSRLNGLDTRLSAQVNALSAQLNVVHNRLNRIDNRFDGIETAMSDMKNYLQERMEAMEKKVELALTDINPRQDVGTTQPDTTVQPAITQEPLVLKFILDDFGETYIDGSLIDNTARWSSVVTRNIPALTRLLAFNVTNTGGQTGVVASVSNGVKTDTSPAWKCSQVYEEGWNQVGFDDCHWSDVDKQGVHAAGVDYFAFKIGCKSEDRGPFFFRRMLT